MRDIDLAIKQLPEKKAPGTDGLPAILFKKCYAQLKIPLSIIINTSIKESIFPSKLKEALIIPIPKKCNSVETSNHRPVSTLNTIAKIYENILYSKISSLIFNAISEHQHGFVERKSTISNLIEFCDFTAKEMTQHQVDTIYTDIMKCFDSVNHDAIIHKLEQYLSPSLVKLLDSYLRNRKNYVIYENCISGEFSPSSGIVQGSKLSSLLFILTFDDLKHHIHHSHYKMYADDLKIYKTIKTQSDCDLLQEDINNTQKWLKTIGLTFHPDKCYKVTYTNKIAKIDHTYNIDRKEIEEVSKIKDLGICFNNNLTWGEHMNQVTLKSYRKLGMVIRYCQPIQDIDTITLLYKSIVRSTIEYGSVIWTPKTAVAIKNIERIQSKFVRYLFQKFNGFYPKYPTYIEYNILIENLPIQSLKERILNNQMTLLKNIINNQMNSPYILSQLTFRIPNHRTRTDPNNLFAIPNLQNNNLLKSPIIYAMKLYNELEEKPNIFS